MAFNLKVFSGVTIQQVRDTMNYKQYMVTDADVEGIRVKPDDKTSPVLLSIILHNEDERKSEPIQ